MALGLHSALAEIIIKIRSRTSWSQVSIMLQPLAAKISQNSSSISSSTNLKIGSSMELLAKGRKPPERIWKRMRPALKMSTLSPLYPLSFYLNTSGAISGGVPSLSKSLPEYSIASAYPLSGTDMPKSAISGLKSCERRMLFTLRSLCAIPLRYRWLTASMIGSKILSASSWLKGLS